MIAFLQFLVALMLTVAATESRAPFDPGGALTALALFGGVAAISGRMFERSVEATEDPARRLGWVALASNAGRIAALAMSWVLLARHGCVRLPEVLGVASWPFVPHLVRLLPFVVASTVVRAALHGAAATARATPPALRTSLALDAKLALLPLAPMLVLIGATDLMMRADRSTWLGRAWLDVVELPTARTFVMLGCVFVAFLALPWVLRRVWRCRPLPPGPLRDRLEAYSARVGFRARDILVWPTGGRHINAAVVGLLPRFRYVFLTDGLLQILAPDEVEAVFAHEAGHARRGHVPIFLGYTGLLALAAFLPGTVLGPLEALSAEIPEVFRALLVVLVWLGFVFGWVSRRFEQEADVFGIETLPPARRDDGSPAPPEEHPFARALERIAAAAGGIREMTGWRHFSIAQRVEFVRQYLADGDVRRTYRRHILLLRGVLLAAIAVTGTFAVARFPFDVREARSRRMLVELDAALAATDPAERAASFARAADAARSAGRTDDALRWYGAAAALGCAPEVLLEWAECLDLAGLPLGAAAACEDLAAREDASAGLRRVAAERARTYASRAR